MSAANVANVADAARVSEGEIMSGESLTCEANKAIVRRIYEEGYNRGNVSIYDELYQPNFVHHSKTIHDIEPGAAGEAESMKRFRQAIPDVEFTILDQIAERDLVATRLRINGNPIARFGDIGPEGGVFDVQSMVLFRMEDGRVAEEWLFLNGGTDLRTDDAR
jgi:predicted ester cyclase